MADLSAFFQSPAAPSAPSPAVADAPASSSAPAPSANTPAAPAADPVAPATPDKPVDGAAASQPEYSFDLPSDFKPPADIPLGKIDATAPLAKAAAAYAREHGLTQPQFSSLLKVYADHAVTEIQNYNRTIEQEGKKLGPEAAKRGAAVKQFLIAKVGEEVASDWSARFQKASDIEALEKIAGIYKREVVTVRDGGQAGAPSPNMASGLWPKRLGVTAR